jgi:preprotein translocase subunit Sss1
MYYACLGYDYMFALDDKVSSTMCAGEARHGVRRVCMPRCSTRVEHLAPSSRIPSRTHRPTQDAYILLSEIHGQSLNLCGGVTLVRELESCIFRSVNLVWFNVPPPVQSSFDCI